MRHGQEYPLRQPSSEFLRYANHFIRRSHASGDLFPAVVAEIAHAVPPRGGSNDTGVLIAHDDRAQFLIQLHQLEDADAAPIPRSETMLASRSAKRRQAISIRRHDLARGLAALRADH